MLGTIIKRELLTNITSMRFVLTLLLITVIFTVSGFVFVNRHVQDISDYGNKTNANLSLINEKSENLSELAFQVHTIYKEPRLTQLFCEGYEKTLSNTFKLDAFTIQTPEVIGRMNFFFPRFADIDWVFIISVILSLVALLLTFDSLSGEKERRTLSLVMSNSVPRDKVILGKYISAVLTLMIPLSIGLLINLIIVTLSGLAVNSGQWLNIFFFIGLSLLFLSIFLLLGIFVSGRCAKSSSSIVILLLLWVVIVVIVPACGRIISEKFSPSPSQAELARSFKDAFNDIWANNDRYGENAGNWSSSNPHADWVNPPARTRLKGAISDSRNKINDDYVRQCISQVTLGRNITKLSPATLYQNASEELIGTGISRYQKLYSQLKVYRETLKAFLTEQDNKDPESWHLMSEGTPEVILLSKKPVDFNAVPKFSETVMGMSGALLNTLWDIFALIIINLVLFMAAYVSFLKCDVR